MVDRDIKKTLNLACVELKGEDAMGARSLDKVCDEASCDRDTRGSLSILASVAVVRDDGGDALSGSAFEGVD